MARLEHPHCVAVLDVGMHDGRPYVVMELVSPGESLRSVLDLRPGSTWCARPTIARQMLSGLAHAHELPASVHRDIKPANLMLGHKTGLGDQVKILDFGLARTLDAANVRLTTGLVLGTPSYMSPEQCRDASVDTRSDLYACGVVLLFEMLTGTKPFVSEKDDPIEVVGMHMHRPPAEAQRTSPPSSTSRAWSQWLHAPSPSSQGDRYATAAEFSRGDRGRDARRHDAGGALRSAGARRRQRAPLAPVVASEPAVVIAPPPAPLPQAEPPPPVAEPIPAALVPAMPAVPAVPADPAAPPPLPANVAEPSPWTYVPHARREPAAAREPAAVVRGRHRRRRDHRRRADREELWIVGVVADRAVAVDARRPRNRSRSRLGSLLAPPTVRSADAPGADAAEFVEPSA